MILFGFSVSILGFRVFVLGLCVLGLFLSAVVLPNDITTHKLSVKIKALFPNSGDFKMSATSVKRARNVLTVENKPDNYVLTSRTVCSSNHYSARNVRDSS